MVARKQSRNKKIARKTQTSPKRIMTKRAIKKTARKMVKRVIKRKTPKHVVHKRVAKKVAKRSTRVIHRAPRKKVKASKAKLAKRKPAKKIVRKTRKAKPAKRTTKLTTKRAVKVISKKANTLTKLLETERAKLRPSLKPVPLVEKFIRDLDQAIPPAEILPGGSYAKGTFLKGNYDIDLFVRFPIGTPDAVMSQHIAQALPKAVPMQGSRTYYQLRKGTFLFEIVPVCVVTSPEQILNVTDMSPLHVAYVKGALSPLQKDDVRLAKRFCKAAGIYGAESYVKGFSGYGLEILIAHYGSFEQLLRAAANGWPHAHGTKLVLDPAKHYRDTHSALLRLNEAKTQAPIILIDPVDKNRNAAAAVSVETYERFRAHAQAFLDAPSATFFDPTLSIPRIRAEWKGKKLFIVTVATPSDRQDIAGCKVLAQHDEAVRLLTETGFSLVHNEWRFGEKTSTCWYVLDAATVPRETEQRGPPARPELEAAIAAFKEKHPRALMRTEHTGESRWYAPVTRAYTQADKALAAAWRGTKHTMRRF